MRTYLLYNVIALLLATHLVSSQSLHRRTIRHVASARRTRSFAPKFALSSSLTGRQARFGRSYTQQHDAQDAQQQKSLDDIDSELELQQQFFEQPQQIENFATSEEKNFPAMTTITTKSAAHGYSASPFYSVTSTSRPIMQQNVQQIKDEEEGFLEVSQPQNELEEIELSKNYQPNQGLSYMGQKQSKQFNGALPKSSSPLTGGSAPTSGTTSAAMIDDGAIHDDVFGFEEIHDQDQNSVGSAQGSVRGEPGKDYPVFSSVPETAFKCSQQQFPGYYADVETQCQAFHICQPDGRSDAFLCPNGTIFSQRHFVCVWWYEFDCQTSEQFFALNAELYKEAEVRAQTGDNSDIIGNSVTSSAPLESSSSAGRLSSPKQNLNKVYMSQIDEFRGITTSAPFYSNGKTSLRSSDIYNRPTTQPAQFDISNQLVESVTPSILEAQNYETTPYNLDEALGEEIHSETPLIEALQLTTKLPQINGFKSYGANGGFKANNGHGKKSYSSDYYSTKTTPAATNFGNFGSSTPKISYGNNGVKQAPSKTNGKSSTKPAFSEAAMKGIRNGGSNKSPKSFFGNGKSTNGNGLKYGSPYRGVKH